MHGSTLMVTTECDQCKNRKKTQFKDYYQYTNCLKENYYCNKCKPTRAKITNLKKYGVDNPMKSNDIKDRLKKSVEQKYGVVHFSKTDQYKEKYKNTCLQRYGVDNTSKADSVKELISNLKFKEHNTLEKFRKLLSDQYEIIDYDIDRNFKIYHKKCNQESNIFIGGHYRLYGCGLRRWIWNRK